MLARGRTLSILAPHGIVTLTQSDRPRRVGRDWRDEATPDPHYRHRCPDEIISNAV
jgi:hypothetical protein